MYRFVVCLLFAATSGVEATTAPTTAPPGASLVYMHYYQNADCTGGAFQTIIAPLNTCSCNSQTAGTTCLNGYMKITQSGSIVTPDYTQRLYSDNSCQYPTASIFLGAGECSELRMRVMTNEVAAWSSERVLECNPVGCSYRDFGTNSASTISTIASVGLLAMVANVIYTNLL